MKMNDVWNKIFADDFDGALLLAEERCRCSGNEFDLRTRGLIKLQQGDYAEALLDFQQLQQKERGNNTQSEDTWLYTGLCYYAQGQLEKACSLFEYPLHHAAEFRYTTDIALVPAVLLFFSFKTNSELMRRTAVIELMMRRGPVADFLTGRIDVDAFEQKLVRPLIKNRMECRMAFYTAVMSLIQNDRPAYMRQLRRTVSLKGQYLEFEYYLAKVELELAV